MFFIHPDGVSRTTIRTAVSDWKHVSVVDSSGRLCQSAWQRHALEFVIEPGGGYRLH
jgi:hypothetical protein